MNGFYIVTAILQKITNVERVFFRDTESYFGIIFDDNNRKPICRLHLNKDKKYIETFDNEKNGIKHILTNINDIFNHRDALENVVKFYLKN